MKKTIIQFCIVSILALSAAPGALAAEDDPGMLEIFSGWLTGLFRSDTVGQESGTAYSLPLKICLRRRNSLLFWWSVTPMTAKFGSVIMFQKRRGHNSQSVIRHRYPMLSAATNPCPANWAWAVKSLLSSKQAPKSQNYRNGSSRQTPDNYVTALVDLKSGTVVKMERFDIGDDENRKTVEKIGPAGQVTVK